MKWPKREWKEKKLEKAKILNSSKKIFCKGERKNEAVAYWQGWRKDKKEDPTETFLKMENKYV